MEQADRYLDQLRADGFVFLRDFFPPETADRARAEIDRWYHKDMQERADKGSTAMVHRGSAGVTHLHAPSHVMMVDVYGKSPTLDAMVEKIFTDPVSARVLERVIGKHFKLRGYNVRRMTGVCDPKPAAPYGLPHDWHRDWRGEVGIALLLTDVPTGGNSGTALLPGSHTWPYCPRRHTQLSEKNLLGPLRVSGLSWLVRKLSFFARRLGRRMLGNAVEATGCRGDFFIFFNDTWHGRMPNLHGREGMLLFLGTFPTEFPFPDDVTLPPADVMARLPPALREAVRHDQPVNADRTTLIHWVLSQQRPAPRFSPLWLARVERRCAEVVFAPFLAYNWLRPRLGRAVRAVLGTNKPAAPAPVAPAVEPAAARRLTRGPRHRGSPTRQQGSGDTSLTRLKLLAHPDMRDSAIGLPRRG